MLPLHLVKELIAVFKKYRMVCSLQKSLYNNDCTFIRLCVPLGNTVGNDSCLVGGGFLMRNRYSPPRQHKPSLFTTHETDSITHFRQGTKFNYLNTAPRKGLIIVLLLHITLFARPK